MAPVCLVAAGLTLATGATRSPRAARAEPLPELSLPPPPAAEPAPRFPSSRATLPFEGGGAVHVLPPETARRAPVVVALHGMCMDPLATCDAFAPASRDAWLACVTGNAPCGGAADWRGDGEQKARHLDAAAAAVDRAFGPLVAHDEGDVILGFSRGSFVARDVIYARPGRFRGAVFLGAAFVPDADRLRAAGVRRVVLAAGDLDGARPTMQRAATILQAKGLPARFMSLGPIWHALPADLEPFLREALEWVRGGGSPDGKT
jgi:predicted esterase